MEFVTKEKSGIWKLTGAFASDNYTTIGHTIYYPKGSPPDSSVIAHECIHIRQQEEEGIVKYLLLYLLCAPVLWNPWRWKWEYEAYTQGSKWSDAEAKAILRSQAYGWLRNN